MPVERVPHASHRSNPLPKGRYSIPQGLPPAYGVYELFDWSPTKNTASPTPASSSAGHSTFQRYLQKRRAESPSMQSWVDKQEPHDNANIDSLSISTSSKRPLLFAPTRCSTPAKRGSSQVPLQLLSPSPSPLKSKPKLKPTPRISESYTQQDSTRRNSLPIATSSIPRHLARHADRSFDERYAEDSEVEVLGDPDGEATSFLHDVHNYQDDESDVESEFNVPPSDRGRMRDSRYLDCSAEEKRETSHPTLLGDSKWTGPTQGVLSFRKRPNSQDVPASGRWTFSNDGIGRQSIKDRE
ncbi:hypothetical protein FRC09_014698, partial [Ceratobasidium sp. 395]